MSKISCTECGSNLESPHQILIVCSECRNGWHHQCHRPLISHGDMLAMLKADDDNDIDNGTSGWVCNTCRNRNSKKSKEQTQASLSRNSVSKSREIIDLSHDPVDISGSQSAKPRTYNATAASSEPKLQLGSQTNRKSTPYPIPSPGLSRSKTVDHKPNSTDNSPSFQSYVSPLTSIMRDTVLGIGAVAGGSTTQVPASKSLASSKEDILTRKMSNLEVTITDRRDLTLIPERSSSQKPEEVRLMTALLREELESENNDLITRSSKPRLHSKFQAKRIRVTSRKGTQKLNGFTNFFFYPSQ